MNRTNERLIIGGASLGWLGAGLYGVWEIMSEDSADEWERPYVLFSISLFVAAALTLAIGWERTRDTERAVLRRLGVGVGALAVASSLVAWALPLWMTLIAVSFSTLATAARRQEQPFLAAIAAAQVAGIAVLFAAMAAEVGRQDRYGDHPVAFGLSLVATAGLSLLGLAALARHDPATNRRSQASIGQSPSRVS